MSKSCFCAPKLRKFLGTNNSGQVIVTYALALIPLFTAVGAAVDYGVVTRAKGQLDAVADMAVLASVSQTGMQSDAHTSQMSATNLFQSQAATVNGATLNSASASVIDLAAGRTAALTYQAAIKTYFLKVAGLNQVTVSGSSTASNSPGKYMDFYVLVDNTPSMGIGAKQSDINTMVANTPTDPNSPIYACGFACHDRSGGEDTYSLAKSLGVTMRIDEVRAALQSLLGTAQSVETMPGQYRVAVYTFGPGADTQGLTQIQPLTAVLSTASAAASGIDVMSVPYQTYRADTDTPFTDILTSLSAELPTQPGDGTKANPLRYLFIITDGMVDRTTGPACTATSDPGTDNVTGVTWPRCMEPIITSYCTALKNQGTNIMILYTTYLPLPTNLFYNMWIAPFIAQVPSALQNCASPNLYAEVNPLNVTISSAMTALFAQTITARSARLVK